MKLLDHPALASLGIIAILFLAYAAVEAIDASTEARIELAQAYRDGCLPGPGETAMIVSDGRTAQCRIYTTASLTTGRAPQILSVAAVQLHP